MKTINVVAAIIVSEDKRIFATQRGYGDYKGWWEFPGGKIENGETPQQALVREIREELTAEISVGELIKTIVTTNMVDAIAKYYGIKVTECLTGFKWIGKEILRMETSGKGQYLFGTYPERK